MNASLQQEVRSVGDIKVVGIGGAGENIVTRMASMGIAGVELLVLNTDMRQGQPSPVRKIQLGETLSGSSGTNGSIEAGRRSAEESRGVITEALSGARMVLLIAGMGGGTGTGAAPVVAQIAKEMGIPTACVVTEPFPFEGKKRQEQAEQGIALLRAVAGSVQTVSNGQLMTDSAVMTKFSTAMDAAAIMACQAVRRLVGQEKNAECNDIDLPDIPQVLSSSGNTGIESMGGPYPLQLEKRGLAARIGHFLAALLCKLLPDTNSDFPKEIPERELCPECNGAGYISSTPVEDQSKTYNPLVYGTRCSACGGDGLK